MTEATVSWDRNVAPGGEVLQPGSTRENLTGAWRTEHPEIDFERCTHCMICWVMCPDSAFTAEEGRLTGVDLDHCKGCGICSVECPTHCITMAPEARE